MRPRSSLIPAQLPGPDPCQTLAQTWPTRTCSQTCQTWPRPGPDQPTEPRSLCRSAGRPPPPGATVTAWSLPRPQRVLAAFCHIESTVRRRRLDDLSIYLQILHLSNNLKLLWYLHQCVHGEYSIRISSRRHSTVARIVNLKLSSVQRAEPRIPHHFFKRNELKVVKFPASSLSISPLKTCLCCGCTVQAADHQTLPSTCIKFSVSKCYALSLKPLHHFPRPITNPYNNDGQGIA